ncbi:MULTISPECIES: phosphate-starvation-inducible protein PsiE [Priestia]|uniref:phosphate-starvation-inducible protein PsiE n=1 Tax=Priestia TaxID=2800373 RepID=UPI001C0CF41A|nr:MULTISPECIES: phosphate-starvation-inducible protein PsiE [Priestia]MBU3568816.1 phosphate-starvation-inducible protein PsiE [Priestia aryabhattai]MDP1442080.1 phosphate-starvation-inducible protein PsiE [Priestia megaterium]MDP1471143.1 phosphate-starvation-inducible protein PsiE [Priestia megaterium]
MGRGYEKWLVKIYQLVLNVALIVLSIILTYFLFRELYYIFKDISLGIKNVHEIFSKVLVFFLYFGFISMISTYFKEKHHFPLRYLLYIGITATIRFIIVNNGDSIQNFWLSIVILMLVISYLILPPPETKNKRAS